MKADRKMTGETTGTAKFPRPLLLLQSLCKLQHRAAGTLPHRADFSGGGDPRQRPISASVSHLQNFIPVEVNWVATVGNFPHLHPAEGKADLSRTEHACTDERRPYILGSTEVEEPTNLPSMTEVMVPVFMAIRRSLHKSFLERVAMMVATTMSVRS